VAVQGKDGDLPGCVCGVGERIVEGHEYNIPPSDGGLLCFLRRGERNDTQWFR